MQLPQTDSRATKSTTDGFTISGISERNYLSEKVKNKAEKKIKSKFRKFMRDKLNNYNSNQGST